MNKCPLQDFVLQPKIAPKRLWVSWHGGERSLECVSLSAAAAKSLQSCPTLCDPIDGSPSGSSVPGILQARTLEWVAIAFSEVAI